MLRLLLSRPAMLLWGVLLANWLSEERRRPRTGAPRRRVAGPAPRVDTRPETASPPV